MKIGILGAMVEEIEPILAKMQGVKEEIYAQNSFFMGSYGGVDLVVAYSKIGKVFSALSASLMVQRYECDTVLFSGVAGAINPNLHIGDLVVATKLCQHDLDITAFGHPYGFVPEGKIYVQCTQRLIGIAKEIASSRAIELKEGIIATGDKFVADDKHKRWIYENFHADAIEMEGASVAVVCDALDVEFFILRAISDSADVDAGFDFDTFLKRSAKKSAQFILDMVQKIDERT